MLNLWWSLWVKSCRILCDSSGSSHWMSVFSLSVMMGPSSAAPSTRRWTTSWRRRSLWPGPPAVTTLASASLPNISWIKTLLCLWVKQLLTCSFVVKQFMKQFSCLASCLIFASQAKVNNASLIGVGYTQSLRPGTLLICELFCVNHMEQSNLSHHQVSSSIRRGWMSQVLYMKVKVDYIKHCLLSWTHFHALMAT